MTALDLLITIGILVAFGLTIYLRTSKRKFQDLILDIRDLIKSMKEKHD